MKTSHFVVIAAVVLTSNLAIAGEAVVVKQGISEQEVLEAQKAWCGALIDCNQNAKMRLTQDFVLRL